MADHRWDTLNTVFSRPSGFGNESGALPNGVYEPGSENLDRLRKHTKVLVIGAGGLGCEMLKDLALSGFTDVHVIDMDTIDISNLNRQFLFRLKDVGRFKADVAAEFIMNRVKGCVVTPYNCAIQTKDREFYKQFKCVISGLDNIEARRWLNSMLVNLVECDEDGDPDPDTIIPMIDGGTEGLKGQGRVIIPKVTSCFECTIGLFPPQKSFPMCTIAETPRIPEHCITYVYLLEWERQFPGKKLDKDSPADMQWVYEKALERAERFGISGVTYFKTMGVVKNIIPAVASTNAVIAAVCVNEALKLITYGSQTLNTYFMYVGNEGINSPVFDNGRQDTCVVCSRAAEARKMTVSGTMTLSAFLQELCDDSVLQLKKPSVMGQSINLYMQRPPSLEQSLRPNLAKTMSELVGNGETLTVTDPTLHEVSVSIELQLV